MFTGCSCTLAVCSSLATNKELKNAGKNLTTNGAVAFTAATDPGANLFANHPRAVKAAKYGATTKALNNALPGNQNNWLAAHKPNFTPSPIAQPIVSADFFTAQVKYPNINRYLPISVKEIFFVHTNTLTFPKEFVYRV